MHFLLHKCDRHKSVEDVEGKLPTAGDTVPVLSCGREKIITPTMVFVHSNLVYLLLTYPAVPAHPASYGVVTTSNWNFLLSRYGREQISKQMRLYCPFNPNGSSVQLDC